MCSSFVCDFSLLHCKYILDSTEFKCLQNIKLYHFVRTILSIPLCPIPFCPYTILSIPFCPYHFVPYHFVRSPPLGSPKVKSAVDCQLDCPKETSSHVL